MRRRCPHHAGFGVDGTAGMKKGLWGYESGLPSLVMVLFGFKNVMPD